MENIPIFRTEYKQIELPPGFRFHPTDEELITHYLSKKVLDTKFYPIAIAEVDLNKCEPWDLPWRAKMGEKEWYFFCVRDRKYPTGLRTNRATEAGYWKATGKDKEILEGKKIVVGMKKSLVFYKGRAPNGDKTDWVMHEYRLQGKYSVYNLPHIAKNEWVICRVFQKSPSGEKINISGFKNSISYDIHLPPLMDTSPHSNETITGTTAANTTGETSQVTCFSDPMEDQKIPQDQTIDSFNTCLSSDTSLSNSNDPNQIINNGNHLQFSDYFWIQDHSILKMLQSSKQNLNEEFYQDSSSCAEAVELGCLWNY